MDKPDGTRDYILQNIAEHLEAVIDWADMLDDETRIKIKNSMSYEGHYGPEGAWVVTKKALDKG